MNIYGSILLTFLHASAGAGKSKLPPCLTKYHAIKNYPALK